MSAERHVEALQGRDSATVLEAARALKKIAEQHPEQLAPFKRKLIKAAMSEVGPFTDVRTRWQLTIVLGALPLSGNERLAAVDWLFERLRDESGLQRTVSMQALFDLSTSDPPLRERALTIAREFAANGTPAMRARARKLLKQS